MKNEKENALRGKKITFFIVVAVIALLGYLAAFGLEFSIRDKDYEIKGAGKMRFGIDIRGGIEAIYEPKDPETKPTEEQLEAARAVIETRLDLRNITDRELRVDVDNAMLIVRFPWASSEIEFDPQKAIAEIGQRQCCHSETPKGIYCSRGYRHNSKPVYDPNEPHINIS